MIEEVLSREGGSYNQDFIKLILEPGSSDP